MRFQDITSSAAAARLGLFIGQNLPRPVGYGLARLVAGIVARRKPGIYWTVRTNLRQVLGPDVGDAELHEMARRVFYHAGQTYYDFFRAVRLPLAELRSAAHIPPSLVESLLAEQASRRGILLLGVHTSNFDLGMLAISAHGLPIQALSVANPGAGFRLLNRLRATAGLEITPISPDALRTAIRQLKQGGIVLTGADWPTPEEYAAGEEMVEFFGRPSYLPTGPARLALMGNALAYVGSCHYDSRTGYTMRYAGPIEMTRTGDRRRDVLLNTRRIAAIIEEFVRSCPEQWMMFHPCWPAAAG